MSAPLTTLFNILKDNQTQAWTRAEIPKHSFVCSSQKRTAVIPGRDEGIYSIFNFFFFLEVIDEARLVVNRPRC